MHMLRSALASLVVGVSTALVLGAVSILPFLNPVWVGFEQERAQAAAWTGYDPADLRAATDAILSDLVLGPPRFDVQVGGQAVLTERERGHMRDVRGVFGGFFVAAGIGALALLAAFAATRGRDRAALWRRVSRAGGVVAVVTVAGGLAGLLFFDRAFILFHEVFFPQGNYLFDPRTDRLVQLFPESFWVESTIAVGVVLAVLAVGLALLGGRRAALIEARASRTPAALSAVPVR